MKRLRRLCFFILLASVACGWMARSAGGQPNFARRIWRASDGLPEDTVQALTVSKDGYLWIGTSGGLVRFDGFRMDALPNVPDRALLNNSTFCLATGSSGVWAGTEGEGLFHFHDGKVQTYSTAQGLSDRFVRAVLVDREQRVWVGTDDGVFLVDGNRVRRIDARPGFAPLAVHAMVQDRTGGIWVGGSRLVTFRPAEVLAGRPVREVALPGSDSKNRVKSILETRDGTLWVGTVGGLQRRIGARFVAVPGLQSTVRSLLQTQDGDLWVGTIGDGLRIVRSGNLLPARASGLPSDTVLALFEDAQQQVWAGTQAGLVRLQRTPVRVVPLPESGDPDYETIAAGEAEDVWVVAQRLYDIHNMVAHAVTLPGLERVQLRNTLHASNGDLWVGTDGSGVYRLRHGQAAHFLAPDALPNNFVRALLETRNGDIWVGTDEGVSRITGDRFQKFGERDGLAFFSTRCLLEDSRGNIWIGTDRGLSRWRNGEFHHDEVTRQLAQEKIWSILEDHQGTLWFGTRGDGLFRLKSGALTRLGTQDGLPSESVYSMMQDRRHTFWLTGPSVLASAPEADMEGETPRGDQPIPFQLYAIPFQADGAQFYGGRQASGFLAPDDTPWFPTTRGTLQVLGPQTGNGPAPHIQLAGMVADNRALALTPGVEVPAKTERLSFLFTCISLDAGERVVLRYKLEGFDREWSVASADRLATWTNLPAGHYRLRLMATNPSRPGEAVALSFPFSKRPFFYQTWWFVALLVALLALLTWLIYRLRVRQIQARFHAVLEERTRLAREMHDTVIQGCTGVSALLEAIASTPGPADPDRQALLDYARTQARATIDEARLAIWNMHHEHEAEVDLPGALASITEQVRREFALEVAFETPPEPVLLRASTAHELIMVAREAIHNAFQHSGVLAVRMSLQTSAHEVIVIVMDRGQGFLNDEVALTREGHYGIKGMRERMKRVGGALEVESTPGQGTTVTLRVQQGSQTSRE